MRSIPFLISIAFAVGCGPSSRGNDDAADAAGGDDTTTCTTGTRCFGSMYQECQGGEWVTTESCTGDQVCIEGTGCSLVDQCAQAVADRSYIGCEYWPVDLDNAVEVLGVDIGLGCAIYTPSAVLKTIPVCWDGSNSYGQCDYNMNCPAAYSCSTQPVCVLDAQHSPFAIVVSNPSSANPVDVTLSNAAGDTQMVSVGPSAVQAIFPQMLGLPDASLDQSGLSTKAYKLTSTTPIVAYQFNPLNNVGVFSNDASLLIPAHAYDLDYIAVTYKTLTRRPQTNDYNGYVTIVGSAATPTMVTVTTTAAVRAGMGVPAMAAGSSHDFMLDQFQTLNLEAAANGDLTGSTITCSQPCGVFVGHEATVLSQMPTSPCCADHLEEQLFPASTWGKKVVVARSKPRTTSVPDMVRIMAQRPGTMVTFNPAHAGCATPLAAGDHCDIFINADIEVAANEPILVAHYLTSNGGVDPDAGDPSQSFAVPTEQYRTDYTLLVPSQYNQSYLSLVTLAAGTVAIDGTDVTAQLQPFGSNEFKAGRVLTTAGQHRVTCGLGCGIEIYGWSDAVSYLVAAGLDLEQIVIE